MVNQPKDYRWSSYHANARGKADSLITPHDQYLSIARTETTRREAYRELFKAHLDAETLEEIRQSTNGNFALGNESFKKQIEKALAARAARNVGAAEAGGERQCLAVGMMRNRGLSPIICPYY